MSIQAAIAEYAADMNVSIADATCFLNSIVIGLLKDKADDFFLSTSDEVRGELVQAYAVHAVRKFEQFRATYTTNDSAGAAFRATVLADLQA